ncbi:TPA: hypothetical protein ACU9QB_005984, partial [Pseudomonas aeruginosa]
MLRPTLPERENGTYFVLPKAGKPPQAGAQPHARDMVAAINPAYLEFSKTRRTSFRPMNLLLSVWAGGMSFMSFLGLEISSWTMGDQSGLIGQSIGATVLLI